MTSLPEQVRQLYGEMHKHLGGDIPKALAAWRCALARFRTFTQFAEHNPELYEEGYRLLSMVVADCEWGDSADALTEAVIFRAQLQVRLAA